MQLRATRHPSDASRDLASAVFEVTNVLQIVLDAEGRIVRFNPACEQVTGFGLDEAEGRPFWEVVVPADEAEVTKQLFLELLELGTTRSRGEFIWATKGGARVPLEVTGCALLDEAGSVEYVVCTGIDLSERNQTLEALRESEERFRSAFDFAPAGMALTGSPDGRWLRVNRVLCEMLG